MRGGKVHTLVLLDPMVTEHYVSEHNPSITWDSVYRWQCSSCGERFQKRNPSPSCPIDMILQVDEVVHELNGAPEPIVDRALLQRYRWEKFVRQRYIAAWKQWRAFRGVTEKGAPSNAHEEEDERTGPRQDSELHDGHSPAEVASGDPGDPGGPRGPRHLGTLRRRS